MNYIKGKMIRLLREKNNLTQAALAEKINVSDKAVSKWENDRGMPDITILPVLAEALHVSVAELLAGDEITNENVCGNMKNSLFYVCPICKNVIHSVGKGVFSCHGIVLPSLSAEETKGTIEVKNVENMYLVSADSPMTKDDYVLFMAYVSADTTQIVRLYPEQEAQGAFLRKGHGIVYAYDIRNGLYKKMI